MNLPKLVPKTLLLALVTVIGSTIAPAVPAVANPATETQPENGRIAFNEVNFARQSVAILTVSPNGRRVEHVTHPRSGIVTAVPDWSHDGRWIAFQKGSWDSFAYHIIVMRSSGSHRTDLTEGSCPPEECSGEGLPVWSRDGTLIAFHRFDHERVPSIYVMRSDGTRRQRVTDPSGRVEDWYPSLSPSGTRIVFTRLSNVNGFAALFTVRANGTHLERITPWRMDAAHPDWSPNGRWIVFENHLTGGKPQQVCLIHPDGTGFRRITHGDETAWSRPSFSPDGRSIAALGVPGENGENDVYVMSIDGAGIRAVTATLPVGRAEGVPDWGSRR